MTDEFVTRRESDQRFGQLRELRVADQLATTTALAAADKAVQAALLAAKEAVEKANTASDKRFEAVNEFRGQLNDIVTTLISRAEADARFNAMDSRLGEMKSTLDKGFAGADASKATGQQNWGILIGAVGLIAVVLTTFWNLSGR